MATWHLGWHTLLSKYLHSKCGQDPVLDAVLCKLHGAIPESRQTLAHGASVAVAAQHRLTVDALFRTEGTSGTPSWLPPWLAPLSFKGQFMSSVEAAASSQEQFGQVRHLALTDSKAAQGAKALW